MKKIYLSSLKKIKIFSLFTSFLFSLLFGSVLFAQVVVTNPTTPWTVPAGVTSIKVEVWGGGGAGGGTALTGGTNRGSSGGGGAYNTATWTVSVGQNYVITKGAGGAGGSNANGANGTATVVTGPAGTVTGNFGTGGQRNGGTAGVGGTGFFNGGNGLIGSANGPGGGGGAGNSGAGGAGTNTAAGAGGAGTPNAAPYIGGTGGGATTSSGDGKDASVPGGGGGGALSSFAGAHSGGDGGAGQVLITYYLPPTITSFTPTATCSGTTPTVTITGTNFTGATVVKFFNGVNATSFTVVNATTITAVLPVTAATGVITVITPGGTATSSSSFTINPNPTVNAGGAIAAICQGGTTGALGGSFGGGATAAVWSDGGAGGTFANNTGSTPGTATYTASATAGTSVTLTLITSGGSCGTTSANKNLTVNPNPSVNAGGVIAAICQGGTTGSLGGSFGGGATAAVWSDGGAGGTFANNTGSTPGTATYTASATAAASVTLTLTTSGGSCGTIFATKTLTVNPNPTVNAGGAIAAICQGGTTGALGGSFGGGATAAVWSDGGAGGTFANNTGSTPGTATYTASPTAAASVTLTLTTSGGSCGTIFATKTLTVNPSPTVNAGAAVAAICQGGTTGALGGSFGGGATAAVWSDGGAGGTFANNTGSTPGAATYTALATAPASITLTLTTSGGLCGTATDSKTLTVYQSVAITGNPGPLYQKLCAAANVTYTVTATGSGPLTYQWFRSGNTVTNGGRISGATSNALTITGVTLADSGTYLVVVSGLSPCTPATSDTAHLDVDQRITFTVQPVTPQTICEGLPYTISATATGTVAIFEWYKNGTAYATGTSDGMNTFTLSIPNIATTDAGSYRLFLDDGGSGCSSANSNVGVLNVNTNTTIATNPTVTQTVCQNGTPTNLSVTAAGTGPFTYQWYSNPANDNTTGSLISGATSSTYMPPTATTGTVYYYVIVTGNCNPATSATAAVIINPTPSIAAKIASTCSGTGFNVTPVDGTDEVPAGTTYSWSSPSVTGGLTGGAAGSNASSVTGTLGNPTNTNQTATYTVTPKSGSCTGLTFTVTVTVIPTPFVTAQTSTTCSGIAFSITPANGSGNIVPSGTTYSWSVPTVTGGMTGGATGTNATSITGSLTNSTNAAQTATYTVTPTSGTCTGSTFTVTITVKPKAAITAKVTTTCSGIGFSVTPVDGSGGDVIPTGTTYSWPAPAVTGGLTGGTTGTNASSITGTLTNPTNIVQTATYTVTPTSGTCTGVTFTVTVTVNPKATIAAKTQTTCSGGSFSVTPVNGTDIVPAGTTYSWSAPTVTGGITGGASGTNATSITGTLTNPTNINQTATYTVTPTSGTCAGSTFTVTVTVTSTPFVTSQTSTTCSGTAFSVTPANGSGNIVPSGTTYSWSAPTVTGGLAGGASGTNASGISGTLTNPTNTTQTATYTVTPTSGTCTGATFTVTITVNPKASITAKTATTCSGSGFSVAPVDGSGGDVIPAGTTYSWSAPTVTGSMTGGAAATNQTSISGTLTNPNNTAQTATYTVTPTSGACAGATFTVNVTVNPKPSVTAKTATTCSGTGFNVTPTNGSGSIVPSGTTYSWSAPVVTGGLTGGAAGSGASSITGTLVNPTNTNQTATYTVTPTSGTCTGSTFTVTVTVTSTPFVTDQTTTTCSGSGFSVSPANGGGNIIPTGTRYAWSAPVVTGGMTGGAAAANKASITGTLNNTTATSQTATYTVTPSTSSCTGSTFTITVTVNPLPTITTTGIVAPVCFSASSQNSSLAYTATTQSPTTYSINWTGLADVTDQPLPPSPITIPIPAGRTPGTYTGTLTVTNANGCVSNGVPVSITINALPTPSLINSPASPVCANTNVTYTTDASQTNYVWTFSGTAGTDYTLVSGGNSTSNTAVVNWITTGTKTVTVNYTNGNTCTAVNPTSNSITVLAVPTGSITITENSGTTPNDNIICQGDAVTFTAPNGGTGASYTFKVNGSIVQGPSTANTYSTTTLANGQTITVDVANSNNCGSTFTAPSVTVNPLPTPTLSVNPTSPVCAGDNVTFTAGGGGTGATYTFKVNGSSVQSSASTTYSTTTLPAGSNTITVDATNSNGCTATSSPVTVTVKTPPSGTVSVSPGKTFCAGTSVTFTATPAGLGNYNFKINGVTAPGGNSTSNTYTTTALTNGQVVTVDVTNSGGCTASFTPAITVTVNPVPTGTLTASENSGTPNDYKICTGSNVTFTATSGFSNYAFYLNGTGSPLYNGSVNTYSTSSLANGNYLTVVVTNGSLCTATFTSPAVTVIQPPSGTLTASPNAPICTGDNVDFTATAGFSNYNFKVNGVSFQNGASNTASYSGFTANATVTVDISNTQTCISTFGPLSITVNPLPTGTLTPVETSGNGNNDSTICTGATIIFTATAGYTNYNFKLNGNTVQYSSGNTYTSDTVKNGDIISVEVTNASNCVATFNSNKITVNPLPVVASVTGPSTVCQNNTITLSDATSGGVWSSLKTAIATVDPSTGVVTGVSAGTDSINYTYTNGNGCSSTVSKLITVNAPPVVGAITGNFNICVGYTSPMSDTTAGGTWSSDNNPVATVDPSTGLVNGVSNGNATISYTVTGANGCITTVTAIVTVSDIPTVAPITTTAPSFAVCVGSTIPLKDATTGGVWASGNMAVATISPAGVVTGVSNGSSLITYSIVTSCGQTAFSSVTITVNPLATGSVSGTTAVCQNSTSPNITFTGITGTAPFTFTYNINGGSTQTVSTTSGNSVNVPAPVTTAGNFTYNLLTVGDANGCSEAQSGSATITVNPSPTATISGSASVCINGSANITFTGANGTAPYTFTYNINGGSNLTATSVGNTSTVPVVTSVAGAYTYNLVSVQDGSTTLCSGSASGSVTVTVTAASVGGSVAANQTICSGSNPADLTLTGYTGSIVKWQKASNAAFTTPTDIANASATLTGATIGALTATTYFRAIVQSGNCSSANSSSVTITVNAPSVGGSVAANQNICSGSSPANLTLSGNTGNVVKWQKASDVAFTSPTDITNTTTTLTGAAIGPLTATTYFRAVVQNSPCSVVYSSSVTITVNPLPTATISAPANACQNASPAPVVTFTGGNGTAPYIFTYKINSGSNQTVTSTGNTAAVAISTATVTSYTYTLVSVSDNNGCSQGQSGSATVNVLAPPAAFVLTPSGTVNVCQGNVQPLIATVTAPTPGSVTVPSGTINASIPDDLDLGIFGNYPGSVTRNLTVSTVPAGAVINSISVNFTITHPYDNDLVLNLKAPNGNVLNLVNREGASGDNFTNTTVSSTGTTIFTNVASAAPFTGTYAPDAVNGVGTPNSTVASFVSLFSTPNGTWTFGAEDDASGNTGKIVNWSITINYTVPGTPLPVIWSPTTDLYTDAGATISYTGTALSTVYAKPSSSGTKIYTATATNAANCSTSQNVTLNVGTSPVAAITADYCAVAGKVQLTANVVPAATSYLWSTGETTQTILVDESGIYSVTAYSAGSTCPGKGTISVANELVINGSFEAGDAGFTSQYTSRTGSFYNGSNTSGLWPEGYYAVDTIANSPSNGVGYHPNFWGHDHTTTHGKYMIINGSPSAAKVWQETVNVLPNTTYYFSAWGMSLNSSGPFANLQFNINGAQVGSTDLLAPGVNNNTNNGWSRFYGTWMSGPTVTSAVISITDLQTATGGNDFGLDDISFSTLSTFVDLVSAPGTDAQTVCVNNPITNIVYSAGSSASAPTVAGLPPGVDSSWNGVYLTISGTPTAVGNYSYTVTTTGSCQPATATGTITVQGQKITLTSGSAAQTICINNAISNIVYTVSGTGTGAIVKGLPANIAGVYNSGTKTFTISGIPDTAGVFKDTVIATGTCRPDTAYGTITVQNQSIVAINPADTTQTVCINNGITGITYSLTGTATGASVSGLPSGVSGFVSGTSYILSGTPTLAGTFPYTVTTTGSCSPGATTTGTITVNDSAKIALSSAAGTDAQTVCTSSPLTAITYSITGSGTGASITSGSLPSGVNGSYNSATKTFTISGTPDVAGTFNYTITATGICASTTISGTITVQSPTIVLTSGTASPTLCNGSTLTNIVFTVSGSATGATLSGTLPTGISGVFSGSTFTISGSPSQLGTFNYTVTTTGGCTPAASVNGTITVNNGSIGGTLPAMASVCRGNSGTINLTGNTGNVLRWESSTDGGSTWANITNTTTTLSYTNLAVPTQYRALVKSGSCTAVYSSVDSVNIHNYWTGASGTDWNTASNWSDNQVPSISCPDAYIPNTTNKPILGSGTGSIDNLHIFTGATLTVNGTGTLQIAGTISNSGTFDASAGKIELNGTSQSISGSTFNNHMVKDLVVTSGGSGLTVSNTAGDTLNISESLTFGNATAKLTTGDNLTLKSTASGTASVGKLAAGNTISGDVTVERYIATGTGSAPNHGKSWQLLAIPTSGPQTIKDAWQEGASQSNISSPLPGSAGNPHGGYGTMITSDYTDATTRGFDDYTPPGPSLKVFNAATLGYTGKPNTTPTPIYDQKGYFVLVRGNRTVTVYNQPANATVLRTNGILFTADPAHLPPITNVGNNAFESVGNPYASALDMRNIIRSANVSAVFQVWDPRLGGGYNLGAFQTLIRNTSTGNYEITPGNGSYGAAGSVNNFIQSGQAFIVQTSGGTGTVSFDENSKANGSALVSRPAYAPQVQQALRTGLHHVNTNGEVDLLDGVLNSFDDSYSNTVDGLDARKSTNTGENLAIKVAGQLLVVERSQPITQQDTIFLNLTGTRVQPYQFQFNAENINATGLQGFLEDTYLHTRTPVNLSGSTTVNFTIENVAGSYAPDRFRIVFAPSVVLPVTFTSIKAYQQDKNINVEWRVENENNMKQYEVEKSINGTSFTTLAVKAATANGGRSAIYVTTDITPVIGYNYYRVKSVDINGKTAYTNIVKVLMGSTKQDIVIVPNPITDGMIHLQLLNQPEGRYGLRLLNNLGQVIVSKQINHAEGSSTELIKWNFNLAHGMYQLEVTKPDGGVKNINVLY